MGSHEISFERLQQIIKEEVSSLVEAVDHKSISDVVGVASKLLSAVENFRAKAPAAAINALTPHLGEVEKMLENMLSTPGSYVPVAKKEPKRVSLKAVRGEGRIREGNEGPGFEPPGAWGRGKVADVAVVEPVACASADPGGPCPCCGSERLMPLPTDEPKEGPSAEVGLVCLECKRTTWSKGTEGIVEATGGDGRFERVGTASTTGGPSNNWMHLEVGNTYLIKAGRDRLTAEFLGWFDAGGEESDPDNDDPSTVQLRFRDTDGDEFEAYWHEGSYCIGSGADPLYVKETD